MDSSTQARHCPVGFNNQSRISRHRPNNVLAEIGLSAYSKLFRDTNTIDGKTFSQRNVAEIFNCREGIHGRTGCVYNKNRFALTDSSVADYLNMLSIFFMIALVALILIFPKYMNIPLIQITVTKMLRNPVCINKYQVPNWV